MATLKRKREIDDFRRKVKSELDLVAVRHGAPDSIWHEQLDTEHNTPEMKSFDGMRYLQDQEKMKHSWATIVSLPKKRSIGAIWYPNKSENGLSQRAVFYRPMGEDNTVFIATPESIRAMRPGRIEVAAFATRIMQESRRGCLCFRGYKSQEQLLSSPEFDCTRFAVLLEFSCTRHTFVYKARDNESRVVYECPFCSQGHSSLRSFVEKHYLFPEPSCVTEWPAMEPLAQCSRKCLLCCTEKYVCRDDKRIIYTGNSITHCPASDNVLWSSVLKDTTLEFDSAFADCMKKISLPARMKSASEALRIFNVEEEDEF